MGRVAVCLLAVMSAAGCSPPGPAPDAVKIAAVGDGVRITNSGAVHRRCEWRLNSDYSLRGRFDLERGEVVYPWSGFVDDDERRRFDPSQEDPSYLYVLCLEPNLSFRHKF